MSLRSGDIETDMVHQNIIGLIGQLDFYQLPDAKGYTSLVRELSGVSDESRQTLREEILSTSVAARR